jgi:hypothetical protein
MIGPTLTCWRHRLFLAGSAVALALVGLATATPPAHAGVWFSVGVPCCGYYGPGPYYGGYPSPYYYAPPPGYYPPQPGAYPPPGPAPSAYTPTPAQPGYAPAGPAPSAYTPAQPAYPPAAAAAPGPAAALAPASPAAAVGITYTSKPAFTNAAGQTCRQYKATDGSAGHPVDVFGTACKQADGQWRVVN